MAHEFILDARGFKKAGVEVEDIAKRLMDYGFHAPTMSFPVAGTLMVEPTESESQAELDRFCEAMIAIRQEIRDVEEGRVKPEESPLRRAPHTAGAVTAAEWDAALLARAGGVPGCPGSGRPSSGPPVARIDNAWGDRNLFCTCPRGRGPRALAHGRRRPRDKTAGPLAAGVCRRSPSARPRAASRAGPPAAPRPPSPPGPPVLSLVLWPALLTLGGHAAAARRRAARLVARLLQPAARRRARDRRASPGSPRSWVPISAGA